MLPGRRNKVGTLLIRKYRSVARENWMARVSSWDSWPFFALWRNRPECCQVSSNDSITVVTSLYTHRLVKTFYKKGCQEKSSASTGGEISFSRSSPLKFHFCGEVWLVVHSREFLCCW